MADENTKNNNSNVTAASKENCEEEILARNSLSITVRVDYVENIDGCKVKEVMVKMEFDGELLCQSDKVKVVKNMADVNLNSCLRVEDNHQKFINDVLNHPILITVYDCSMPEITAPITIDMDSKKKTAKTTASRVSEAPTMASQTVLGVCNLDMGNLFMEKKSLREVLIVYPDKNALIKDSVTWVKLPRLVASAYIEGDLLEKLNEQNVLGVTVESIYNPPEGIAEGALFDAIMTIPTFGDKKNSMTFPSGTATSTRDPLPKKKWCDLRHVEGRGGRTKYEICDASYDVINSLPPDVNLETEMTKRGIKIEWNALRRCAITPSDSNYMYSKLWKYHVWPIQILLANKTNAQKSAKSDKKPKAGGPDGSSSGDHFTAFLNFSSFLYPGVTKVRAAAQLYTFSPSDLSLKFGIEVPPSNSVSSVLSKSKAGPERKMSGKDAEQEKKEEAPGQALVNKEGLPVFVVVEMEFWKPFARQKPPEYLEKELKSYLSLRGKLPKKMVTYETARTSLETAIRHLVSHMTEEFAHFVQFKENKTVDPKDLPSAYVRYLWSRETFNRSVTCLSTQVLGFVHEKFGDLSRYNERLPEVYAAVVREMHKITNNCFIGVDGHSTSGSHPGCLQLFAEEALEERNFDEAKKFLLLNIANNQTHPDFWLDYAVFCIRIEDFDTALEAIREALVLDVYNQVGLLLYGLLMAKLRNGTVAELTFHLLVSKYPLFVEGWKAFHYLYSVFQNLQGEDVTAQMCRRLEWEKKKKMSASSSEEVSVEPSTDKFDCKRFAPPDSYISTGEGKYGVITFVNGISWTEPLSWSTSLCPPENLNVRTSVLMLKLGLFEFSSMALGEDLLGKPGRTPPYYHYYKAVRLYLQGYYIEALYQLEEAIKDYGKDFTLRSLMGHCFYNLGDHENAIACYEYVMESYNRPDDIHLIYLRMGNYYLQTNKFVCAKQVFTTGCKYSPSPRLWKGLGIACLRLNEYEDAETAFGEANYLDNRDPDTWGYLALVNGLLDRFDMLNHCYLEAKRKNLTNGSLANEIERCLNANGLTFDE